MAVHPNCSYPCSQSIFGGSMLVKSPSSILVFGLLAAGSARAAQGTVSSGGQLIANNTPKFAAHATDLGAVSPSTTIEVGLWVNVHNRGQLDELAQSLYDPGSPNFRRWLSNSEFAARFAPTAAEAKTVQEF